MSLETLMAKFIVSLQKRAVLLVQFCVLMFVLDMFLAGFASIMAPALLPIFSYSALSFMVGAIANSFLAKKP